MSKTKPSTLSPITTNGKAFVDSSGNRFMIRGIALSTTMSMNGTDDLLADSNHDYIKNIILPHLQKLEVNTIRVYQVDPTLSHDKVMNLLAENGIYVMVGTVTPAISVDRLDPKYTLSLYDRVTTVAKEFCAYPNTLAFSVGNEVVFPGEIYTDCGNNATQANQTIKDDAQVIKSVIHDLKKYMKDKSLRAVPVGVAMQDGPSSTLSAWGGIGTNVVAQYYAAGDADQRADYIGINTYRYVTPHGGGSGPMNAYDSLATEVKMLCVPVLLTESGGLNIPAGQTAPNSTRDWKIVPQMYSNSKVAPQLSGQIAFEFFEKEGYHGLFIQESDDTKSLKEFQYGKNNEYNGGYKNLATEFKKVSTMSAGAVASTPTSTSAPSECTPPLLPCPAPTIAVTFENYYDKALKVVQNSAVIGLLQAGSKQIPKKTPIMVSKEWPIYIQDEKDPQNWINVCQVDVDKIKAGIVINNDVKWGNSVACPITN